MKLAQREPVAGNQDRVQEAVGVSSTEEREEATTKLVLELNVVISEDSLHPLGFVLKAALSAQLLANTVIDKLLDIYHECGN